ncbi:hypothetical protein ZEAMMB73_Zm00001d014237 [Zea mays]|uniref:Uncharacterized protein n=1 Tax=Zea mays TaxID=4577 RepID=A0A1D6GR61_MAIZE|nr:hypothetical protein ZEAMMB73_Zm00001d014237 [Zea mays]AQK65599.1 hypothetical protein ZEAMMB73_Zm00001d014237 [Zea mays]
MEFLYTGCICKSKLGQKRKSWLGTNQTSLFILGTTIGFVSF